MDLMIDFRQIKIEYGKKNEVEEVDYETIVILTENQGLKTKLKGNKTLDFVEQLYLTEDIIIHVANQINWYAKEY